MSLTQYTCRKCGKEWITGDGDFIDDTLYYDICTDCKKGAKKMKADKFEQLCRELLEKSEDTLFRKSKEYASDEDRLANFRQPTSMMGMSTAEVCLMYQMKHIASIAKIAKETSQGVLPSKELLQEKCQDMLNYTLIFYTTVMEMIEAQELQGPEAKSSLPGVPLPYRPELPDYSQLP